MCTPLRCSYCFDSQTLSELKIQEHHQGSGSGSRGDQEEQAS